MRRSAVMGNTGAQRMERAAPLTSTERGASPEPIRARCRQGNGTCPGQKRKTLQTPLRVV